MGAASREVRRGGGRRGLGQERMRGGGTLLATGQPVGPARCFWAGIKCVELSQKIQKFWLSLENPTGQPTGLQLGPQAAPRAAIETDAVTMASPLLLTPRGPPSAAVTVGPDATSFKLINGKCLNRQAADGPRPRAGGRTGRPLSVRPALPGRWPFPWVQAFETGSAGRLGRVPKWRGGTADPRLKLASFQLLSLTLRGSGELLRWLRGHFLEALHGKKSGTGWSWTAAGRWGIPESEGTAGRRSSAALLEVTWAPPPGRRSTLCAGRPVRAAPHAAPPLVFIAPFPQCLASP